MIRPGASPPPGRPLIQLRQVSKRFDMHREQQRSLQEEFIRFVQRRQDPGRHFWALRDVSFEVKKGQKIALVGATGAGKTSIINLLSRAYEYNQGSIRIDGTELRDFDASYLSRQVGVVLQRRVGRVRADDRGSGRAVDASQDRPAESDAVLHGLLVA